MTGALSLLARLGFLALFALTLWAYARHRDRARRDVLLLFGAPAGFVLLDAAAALRPELPWLAVLARFSVFAHPYLLLRLVGHFRPLPPRWHRLALLALVGSWAILLVPHPRPPGLSFLLPVLFVAVEAGAGALFLREARRAAGAAHWRLRLAAVGAGLLSVGLLLGVAVLRALFPAREVTDMVVYGLALLALLAFYGAFSPPRWLRRLWELPELLAFAYGDVPAAADTEQGVLERLARAAQRVVVASGAVVLRRSPNGDRLVVVVGPPGLEDATLDEPTAGAVHRAWCEGCPSQAPDPASFDCADATLAAPYQARTLLAAPIPGAEGPLGVLVVPRTRPPLFGEDDLDLLGLLAAQAGREIRNLRWLREQQEAAQTRVLYEAARRLQGLGDRSTAIEAILRCLREVLGYERGWLALVDDGQGALVGQAAYGADVPDDVVQTTVPLREDVAHPAVWAVLHRETVLVDDPATDPRVGYLRELYVDLGARGFATVPLLYQGHPVGVVHVDNAPSGRAITAAEFGLLRGFGALAATALHAARLFEDVGRMEAERETERLKTEFVSIVSHEFRTPLASLVGFSELLLTREVGEAERREWLQTMHGEAERLTHLVEDVLDVARLEEGRVRIDRRPLDVRAAVERALAPFAARAGAHRLERRYAEPLPPVLADPEKLTQILTNLVSNALKYSPEGGAVTVAARAGDGAVRLSVADQGLGIPPEELPRLFGRFHRINDPARREIGGTGLGLYITKHLVELQGGRIWAESEGVARGSTFHVELPVAHEEGTEKKER